MAIKLALIWLILSGIVSIVLIERFFHNLPVGNASARAIQISSELQLLKHLMELDEVDKDVLRSKYREVRRSNKQAVVNAQIEGIPIAILAYGFIGLNLINILVVIGIWVGQSRKPKGSSRVGPA